MHLIEQLEGQKNKMNILIDTLPVSVQIGGVEYDISSNFRHSILFEQLIQDRSLENEEKIKSTLDLYYYPQIIPKEHINEAIEKALWFYTCDKDKKQSKGKGKNSKKQIYSYDEDAEFIVGAFRHDYGINLTSIEYLHWWDFKALFKSLNSENEFVKIMSYRAMDLSKIKDKDQKKYYREMQELYKIEEPLTEEEKEDKERWIELLK